MYEDRLLIYGDILGWSDEIRRGDSSTLMAAVENIHQRAEQHNEQSREDLRAQEGKIVETDLGPLRMGKINPMAMEVQFGAFSDHFVFSLPESFGSRIYSIAAKLLVDLLRLGFLTRGAVVLGSLYHVDNIIFGPALLDAVAMEERQAFYPRILVSHSAFVHCATDLDSVPPECALTIRDQTDRIVVNPFALPFEGGDDILDSFVEQNFFFSEIKSMIDQKIEGLEKQDRYDHAEKWAYLRDFVTGPVFRASPRLERYWKEQASR